MDGLQNLAGDKTITREINGKRYTFDVLRLKDHAERERYILSLKPSPLDLLNQLPDLPDPPALPQGAPSPDASPEELKEWAERVREFDRARSRYERLKSERDAIRRDLISQASRPSVVTMQDEMEFDRSLHGQAYSIYLAMRKHHPEINSKDAALQWIEEQGTHAFQQVQAVLDGVNEKDELGN